MTANDRLLALLYVVQRRAPERLEPLFDRHGLDPEDGVSELVEEIKLDGANTIASAFRRGRGVGYDVVVRDVARKLKLKLKKAAPEVDLERRVLDAVMERYIGGASAAQRVQIEDELRGAKMELRGLQEAVGLKEQQVRQVNEEKEKLVKKYAGMRGGGGGGGGAEENFADTYEEVMRDEMRVMQESYEARIRRLKADNAEHTKDHRIKVKGVREEHRRACAQLDGKKRRLEVEVLALKDALRDAKAAPADDATEE